MVRFNKELKNEGWHNRLSNSNPFPRYMYKNICGMEIKDWGLITLKIN